MRNAARLAILWIATTAWTWPAGLQVRDGSARSDYQAEAEAEDWEASDEDDGPESMSSSTIRDNFDDLRMMAGGSSAKSRWNLLNRQPHGPTPNAAACNKSVPHLSKRQRDGSGPGEILDTYLHHNQEWLSTFLARIQDQCQNRLKFASIGKTVLGRDIWAATLEPDDFEGGEDAEVPSVLLLANIHGDEGLGTEILAGLLQELCERHTRAKGGQGYGEDGDAGDHAVDVLLQTTRLTFIFCLNPDGRWLGQRENANGVDLNRNFPDQFQHGASVREPETRAYMSLVKKRSFHLGISFHSGELVCTYPWDGSMYAIIDPISRYARSPDDRLFRTICHTYAEAHSVMALRDDGGNGPITAGVTNGADWYPLFGGLQDFSYWNGVPSVTVELSQDNSVCDAKFLTEYQHNRQAIFSLMEAAHYGIGGTVYCNCGTPRAGQWRARVPAHLSFVEQTVIDVIEEQLPLPPPALQAMVTRTASDGRYHRVLLPGVYNVTVHAPRCSPEPQSFMVTVEQPASVPPGLRGFMENVTTKMSWGLNASASSSHFCAAQRNSSPARRSKN